LYNIYFLAWSAAASQHPFPLLKPDQCNKCSDRRFHVLLYKDMRTLYGQIFQPGRAAAADDDDDTYAFSCELSLSCFIQKRGTAASLSHH
jgi:hypothetical protein